MIHRFGYSPAGPGRAGARSAGELLLREGRHPGADRIERGRLEAGKSPAEARRATVLGRPFEHNQSPETEKAKGRSPWLVMDLVFRAPSTAQIAWALEDDEHRVVLELCQGRRHVGGWHGWIFGLITLEGGSSW
ncbi:hypothetical protein [Streptomyces sp. NPDC056255]|uniref:hypothetical protein n=1 Tax=Streptomyces sp. NPDC056255 TaxID=3345764 RepID=UPI0035DC93E3